MLNSFISLKYLSQRKIRKLINLTEKIKRNPLQFKNSLKGKNVGLLFEKPSLRTKASFYLGASQLGATPIYFSPQEVKLGVRESVADVARTLSRYLDCVVLRTYSHQSILDFVRASQIPVVNGLSDLFHPSQILGDIFTLYELKKDFKKIKVVFIGDGNNVCHSLIYAFSILGGNLTVTSPQGYHPKRAVIEEARNFAKISGARLKFVPDPQEAVRGAEVIYTDVWVSMGKEKERVRRMQAFKNFQVNEKLLKLAQKRCIVMHCLPARRGEEITDAILDGKNSVVFLQAENRLHCAKAILFSLLKKEG